MKGEQAELWAADFLQRQGLKLIAQNYLCRLGEIDLIMLDGETLVFVEVRQRSSADYGGAGGSIDRHKQHRLILTAQYYLMKLHRTPPCRFDVVLMDDTKGLNVQWIKNAFEA
jgi:putative endonuclease